MATSNAIAAAGQALMGLLASACPRDEYPSAQFELYQARNFQTPMEEGISLYLYKVDPNTHLRNLPVRTSLDGLRYRPAVPVDLHYLMSAWARDAVRQQRLLGWAIRTIEDTPVLPSGVLNQHGPEPDIFRQGETVDLVMQTLALQDLAAVWDVAKPNIQPSVCYLARMVTLESSLPMEEFELVQTRQFQSGKLVAS